MDLRLEKQLELAALGGMRKLGLQRKPRFQLLADRILERHIAAALDRLGAIEGDVAVAEQLVRGAATRGEYGRADRNLDAVRARRRLHRLIESTADALCESRHAFRHLGTAERNGEFVAGEPCDERGRADMQVQSRGDR